MMNFPEEPIFLKETGAVIVSRAEYDRLLNIEGEYQRLLAENNNLLDALEGFVTNIDAINLILGRNPVGAAMLDKARAAIARAKGEGK